MKSISIYLIVFLITCSHFCVKATAQNQSSNTEASYSNKVYKNEVKVNATSLLLRNFSFQYERNLLHHLSLALGYRFMPHGNIPQRGLVKSILRDYADLGEQSSEIFTVLDASKLGGFAWTPEVRFYFKRSNRGLYLGLMGRYEQTSLTSVFPFEIDGVKQTAKLNAKFTNVGGGIIIGAKIKLASRVNLDWWIVGPYLGSAKIDLKVNEYKIDQEDLKEFEDQFSDITLSNDYFTATVNPGLEQSTAKITGTIPGIRAMGITFGFKF